MALAHRKGNTTSKESLLFARTVSVCLCLSVCVSLNNLFICAYKSLMLLLCSFDACRRQFMHAFAEKPQENTQFFRTSNS